MKNPFMIQQMILFFCIIHCIWAKVYETADSIIVEADESYSRKPRNNNQESGSAPTNSFPFPFPFGGFFGNNVMATIPQNPCWTSDGKMGSCVAIRQCYPHVKLPALSNLETWVIGIRGTCNYVESNGRQVYGVCCASATNQLNVMPAVSASPNQGSPQNPYVPSFPFPGFPFPGFPFPGFPFPGVPGTSPINKPPPEAPTTTTTTTTTQAPPSSSIGPVSPETEDVKYPINSHNCGTGAQAFDDQDRIVGGTDAVPGSWPYIAALVNNGRQFCGGSLIDTTHVLTAAHCISHMSSWDVSRLEVVLGMHQLKNDPNGIRKKVRRVTRHKGFNQRTLYNDIAILTLASPVEFTRSISPVCLPSSGTQKDYAGENAVVIGWGSLREGGSQPSVLQQVVVTIQTNDACKKNYGNDAPGGIVDHFLCAAQKGKDSCSGDSGGPLLIKQQDKMVQAGIVSWGIGCGQEPYPGVYTRVTSFMKWIVNNLS